MKNMQMKSALQSNKKVVAFLMMACSILSSCDCFQLIHGKVIDKETRMPIKDALIYRTKERGHYSVKTDSIGEFREYRTTGGFRCPPMKVWVEKEGYKTKRVKAKERGRSLTWIELESVTD